MAVGTPVRPAPVSVPPARQSRTWRPLLVAAAVYALVAGALGHRVLTRLDSSTVGWISADSDTFAWWLQWLPIALQRGEDPLLPGYVQAPAGINAMWNIPVFTVGLLMLPVTLLAGPVVSYNLAMLLGPVVSGLLMAVALVPWTRHWTSRIVAGGLYGFSPYLVTHFLVGHLNLVWAVLPPLLLITARALFVVTPRHPVRAGVLLGLALTLQLGLYTQTLALGALVLVLAAVVLAAAHPRRIASRLPTIGRMALGCVPTVAVLCGYPLYVLLLGPSRPEGQLRPALDVRADPLNAVLPTPVSLGGSAGNSERLNAYVGEQGGYLGGAVLLLVLLACLVVRTAVVRVVAVVGVLAFVFSLGPSLTVGGRDLDVWLPWRLLEGVPLLSVAEPVRLQLFVACCVAIVVALWIDRLPDLRSLGSRLAGALLAVAAVASWVPAAPAERADATTPAFFRTADEHLSRSDVVVTVPRPSGAWLGGGLPILWHAESRLAYRMAGGSFLSSDADDDLLYETPENLFEGASRGLLEGLPPSDDGYVAAARQQLLDLGVTVVLVVPQPGVDYSRVEEFATRVAGSSGERIGGVVLYRLPRS